MARQSLMWTALPNGHADGTAALRVSVLLSPRLDPEGDPPKLGSFFPDWEDWPATLARATFTIRLGTRTVDIPATRTTGVSRVDASVGTPDPATWRALFGRELAVKRREYVDRSGEQVVSYDASQVASIVRGLYTSLARTADGNLPTASALLDHPDLTRLRGAIAALDAVTTREGTRLRDPVTQFRTFGRAGGRNVNELVWTLGRFQLFHTPPATPRPVTQRRADDDRIEASWLEYERPPMPAKEDLAKQLDFHQVVAAMNPYRTVLRKLGLVVDLLIDDGAFTAGPDQLLSASVAFPPGALEVPRAPDARPETHVVLSPDRFQAVTDPTRPPGDPRIVDGLLDLDPDRYELLQEDVDGAGLKLLGFARTLQRLEPGDQRVDPVTRLERELGAPSLRNAGLMLVHHDRAATLTSRLAANAARNGRAQQVFDGGEGAKPPELWAEDVVRGYRVDVWDGTTAGWRSLCRRTARYELGGRAVVVTPVPEEEGTVRLAATKSADPASNQDALFLHEALVSWTGWSLAAPPPGRAIRPDDSVDTTSARTDAELPPGLAFRTRFSPVDGSLPRLRIGRRYWLRARAVDLAANSLPPSARDYGGEEPQKRAVTYRRLEPVAAPVLALARPATGSTEKPAEGESMERIAIRSFDATPPGHAAPARRFAVPQRCSLRDAEHHGKLDSAGKLDRSRFPLLVDRDRDATDPSAAVREEIIPTQGPLAAAPSDTVFAVYTEGHALTYLPDPLAEVVAVRVFDHPGIADTEIIRIPLYPAGAWPEALPFQIVVRDDASAKPAFDPTRRALVVPLPKGVRARVRLSFQLSRDALRDMAIWGWLAPGDQAKLEPLALDGQHWMLTPWRTVEVVHAVQRPLLKPEIERLDVARDAQSTSAVPRLVARCSLGTTDRLDLHSEWHEPRDDPRDAQSATRQVDLARSDIAFAVKISDPRSYATRMSHPRGGFAEHTIEGDDLVGVGVRRDDRLMKPRHHELHDTRYRRIEYWLCATTRFREFMPAAILTTERGGRLEPTEENIEVTGPRAVTWIPSSAPPPAPSLLYVVPTFGWVRATDANGNPTSWRRGGGLRVYLDRPWSASGYGEMLAVVLPPPSFAALADEDQRNLPYASQVTQWGHDPIWRSAPVAGPAPQRSQFPLARTAPDPDGKWLPKGAPATERHQPAGPFQVTNLSLPGLPDVATGAGLEIAPHDVFYDEDRGVWYSDIELDAGASYFPFIRLALARYQPVSVAGAHLSSVVLADVISLAPDRWLTVTRAADAATRHVSVYGSTVTGSSGHDEASGAPSMSLIDPLTNTHRTLTPAEVSETTVIEVWVEKLEPAEGEDFGWHRVPGTIAQRRGPGEASGGARTFTASERARAAALQRSRELEPLVREGLLGGVLRFLTLWDGDVTLPSAPRPGERHRVVVAEYEEYLVDDPRPYDRVPEKKDRRLVFVEHVELR